MMAFSILSIFIIPIYFAIPAIILYFVIKLAVKNAIRELKEDRFI